MSLSEFPVNIVNDVMSSVYTLLDPEELDSDHAIVFRTILTFSSETMTPGVRIHKELMRVWLKTPINTVSCMIESTMYQLYKYHRPGSGHSLLWSPIEPRNEATEYIKNVMSICYDNKERTQQRFNAEKILKYLYVIFVNDYQSKKEENVSEPATMFYQLLFSDRNQFLETQIINSTFLSIEKQEEGISEGVILIHSYLELTLQLKCAKEIDQSTISKVVGGFNNLSPNSKQKFLLAFPDGEMKMFLLDCLIEKYGILLSRRAEHLKKIAPSAKKVVKYFFQFNPRDCANGTYLLLLLVCTLAQLCFYNTTFNPEKLKRLTLEYIKKSLTNIETLANKDEKTKAKTQLMNLELNLQGFLNHKE